MAKKLEPIELFIHKNCIKYIEDALSCKGCEFVIKKSRNIFMVKVIITKYKPENLFSAGVIYGSNQDRLDMLNKELNT